MTFVAVTSRNSKKVRFSRQCGTLRAAYVQVRQSQLGGANIQRNCELARFLGGCKLPERTGSRVSCRNVTNRSREYDADPVTWRDDQFVIVTRRHRAMNDVSQNCWSLVFRTPGNLAGGLNVYRQELTHVNLAKRNAGYEFYGCHDNRSLHLQRTPAVHTNLHFTGVSIIADRLLCLQWQHRALLGELSDPPTRGRVNPNLLRCDTMPRHRRNTTVNELPQELVACLTLRLPD